MIKTRLLPVLCFAFLSNLVYSQIPIQIHPENPKYFLFRGKPVVLLTATEHYGSVINRPFDFARYLDDAVEHKINLTRTFLLFRELQDPRNPSSPCKPESPDYIAPFPRTGPGKAKDGEPVYDLDKWNPEFFERLHRFLDAASARGIVVELTLFSNAYADRIWALNPFNAGNNKQQVGHMEWQEYTSLKDPEVVRRQGEYARKIIQETSQYDNVYYEICNEPGGGTKGHVTPAEVDAWQHEMARIVRDEMRLLKRPHLIAGQQAFTYGLKNLFPQEGTYKSSDFQIAVVHPLPETELKGRSYQLGNFMSKELMLSEMAQFCRKASEEKKPTVLDEDNAASMYRDIEGWTIHRKRAWTTLLNGAHYDYIDFSITVGSEAGTVSSRKNLRTWMKHLSEFMSTFDFIHASPDVAWIKAMPDHLVVSGLVVPGKDYAVYLADAREVTDKDAGKAIQGKVTLSLPAGTYRVQTYSPVTGQYSLGVTLRGGNATEFELPEFQHDIVIRATPAR
jgi:hypothetical protein